MLPPVIHIKQNQLPLEYSLFIHLDLKLYQDVKNWERFWRAYTLVKFEDFLVAKKIKMRLPVKFRPLKQAMKTDNFLFNDDDTLALLIIDAWQVRNDQWAKNDMHLTILSEVFWETNFNQIHIESATGFLQMMQSFQAKRLTNIGFDVCFHRDLWNALNFDNKSHFADKMMR
jgi:hypothetical protein